MKSFLRYTTVKLAWRCHRLCPQASELCIQSKQFNPGYVRKFRKNGSPLFVMTLTNRSFDVRLYVNFTRLDFKTLAGWTLGWFVDENNILLLFRHSYIINAMIMYDKNDRFRFVYIHKHSSAVQAGSGGGTSKLQMGITNRFPTSFAAYHSIKLPLLIRLSRVTRPRANIPDRAAPCSANFLFFSQ